MDQILEMHIAGKKKRKVILWEENLLHTYEWVANDALVASWLINFMTDKLVSYFV